MLFNKFNNAKVKINNSKHFYWPFVFFMKLRRKRLVSIGVQEGLLLVLIMFLLLVTVTSATNTQGRHNETTTTTTKLIRSRVLLPNNTRAATRLNAIRNAMKLTATTTTTMTTIPTRAAGTASITRKALQNKKRKLETNFQMQQRKKLRAAQANETQHRRSSVMLHDKQQQKLNSTTITQSRHSLEHRSNASMTTAAPPAKDTQQQTIYGMWQGKAIQAAAAAAANASIGETLTRNNTNSSILELQAGSDWQQGINANEYHSLLYKRVPPAEVTSTSSSSTTTSSTATAQQPMRFETSDAIIIGRRGPSSTASSTLATPSPSRSTSSTRGSTTTTEPPFLPIIRPSQKPQLAAPVATHTPAQLQKLENAAHVLHNKIPDSLPVQLGNWTNAAKPHVLPNLRAAKSLPMKNFQRNKRYMPTGLQLGIPVSYHMPTPLMMMPYHHAAYVPRSPLYNTAAAAYGYHLYPYKARSPHDINSMLAMQQQQQQMAKMKQQQQLQQQLQQQKSLQQSVQQQQHQQQQQQALALAYQQNLVQSYHAQHPVAPVPRVKRIPFKVNLDIFPVMQPTQPFKASPLISMDYHHSTGRPYASASGLHHPFIFSGSPTSLTQ